MKKDKQLSNKVSLSFLVPKEDFIEFRDSSKDLGISIAEYARQVIKTENKKKDVFIKLAKVFD